LADSVTYQNSKWATPPIGTKVEVEVQAGGEQRQVVKVGNTVPVTGTVTANAGTNLNTSALATEAGNLKTIADLIDTRKQTPTVTKAMLVQIGPGDVISNLPVVIDYDHHQLHEGETFRWSTYASLGNAANKDIRLVVPNIDLTGSTAVAKCPHIRFEVISSVGGDAYFYEGTTFTSGAGQGTARTPIAMERNGTYTPKLAIYEDPTVDALGTLLWRGLLLSGKVSAGSTHGVETEFILKNNQAYHFRFTSGGATNLTLIRFLWYEDLGV
jgi:hypothetical protein